MKLKSKLIATIVSICAAIAVMGVGVWAASSSFSVTVTNTVSLAFVGLDGTVKYSANAEQVGAATEEVTAITTEDKAEKTIYSGTQASAEIDVDDCKLAGFFDDAKGYIKGATTAAALMYTFTYTASDDVAPGTAVVKYSVASTGNAQGTIAGGNAFEYSYYINAGEGWVEMSTAAEYYVDATVDVQIIAVAQYTNENAASIKVEGNWTFTVAMEALLGTCKTAATAAGNAAAITDGVFAVTGSATNAAVCTEFTAA